MDVQVKFISKSAVLVRAFIYDDDGELTDPTTSIKVTIVNPDGVKKVDAVLMTKNTDYTKGVYDYIYRTDADSVEGNWLGEVWVVDGSGADATNSPGAFSFEVKKGL